MTRMKRVELAAEKVESGDLSLTQAAQAYGVTIKEVTNEIARIEKQDSDFIKEMCERI